MECLTRSRTRASQWLIKNPEAAQRFGKAINAVIEGSMTMREVTEQHGKDLQAIIKDLMGLQMPTKVSEDDPVFTERMTEMDEVMKVPERKASGGLSGVDQYIINRGI